MSEAISAKTDKPYVTLFPENGHRFNYAAQASLTCPISSTVAGLTFPIVECLRVRL